jgi:hypothetical protein
MAVLAVLADPEKYGQRLQELRDATERYNEAVALVGPAAEIPARLAEARADRERAAAELAAVRAQAAGIVRSAEVEAARVRQMSEKLLAESHLAVEKAKHEQLERERNIDARAGRVERDYELAKQAQDEAARATAEAVATQRVAKAAEETYLARLRALNKVAATFSSSLREASQ